MPCVANMDGSEIYGCAVKGGLRGSTEHRGHPARKAIRPIGGENFCKQGGGTASGNGLHESEGNQICWNTEVLQGGSKKRG